MDEEEWEDEMAWLRDQIDLYVRILPRYRKYAEVLEKILRSACRMYAPLSIVQTRPKTIASFGEKAIRKKHKYREPVNQLTDLCGGRVITTRVIGIDYIYATS